MAGFAQRLAAAFGREGCDDGAAIAALAAAHAAAGLALNGADGFRAGRDSRLDFDPAQLLAAADQRIRLGEFGQEARGGKELPEPGLEAAMAAKACSRHRCSLLLPGAWRETLGAGGVEAGDDAFGLRRRGPAQTGAIPHGIDLGDRGASLGIPLGDDCIVEAGLYLTAGTKLTLLADGEATVLKARELSGAAGLLFRRNSLSGGVEAVPRSGTWGGLNTVLHAQ